MPVVANDVSLPSDNISLGKLWETMKDLGPPSMDFIRYCPTLSDLVYTESNYINFLVYEGYQRSDLPIGDTPSFFQIKVVPRPTGKISFSTIKPSASPLVPRLRAF